MQTLGLQPLQLTIPGAYYDSQIYDGKLYLWKANGSILTLDWNKMIESITISDPLKAVLLFALQHGDDLYNNLLLKDADIKALIIEKFRDLVKTPIEIPESALYNFAISEQNNPFPFPHADSSIHYKTLYVGSQSGVSRSRGISLNSGIEKLWDAPVLSLTASNKTLAIAAGSEGLFDYSVDDSFSENSNEPRNITEEHSNFARWMYPGIFSSSYFNDGYFADFQEIKEPRSKSKELRSSGKHIQLSLFPHLPEKSSLISLPENSSVPKPSRELKQLFSYHEIFTEEARTKQPIFTWGARDKIYLVTEDSIELVRCFPREKKETEKFKSLGSTEVEDLTGDIVSADSSFFGIVLEEEDSLLVINSLLQHKRFPGEPVNWRVFPDSVNYVNQLHIIYEDSIQIYFFTHDYFLNQKDKIIGISFGTE